MDTETGGNKSGKSRSRSFVVWEDESVSTSYVNTLRDPAVAGGAYQEGPAYFEHIHKKWCVLHAAARISHFSLEFLTMIVHRHGKPGAAGPRQSGRTCR